MYALFFILNKVEKLDSLMSRFFDLGVGITVVDSEGMGKILIDNNVSIPILSSVRRLVEGHRPYNKTLFSVIRDDEKLEKAKEILVDELNYIEENGVGFLFVIPVIECHGYGISNN